MWCHTVLFIFTWMKASPGTLIVCWSQYVCFMTLSCQINVGVFSPYQVMELLVHLNKRIKSRPKIQLPVETLLVQYQDPAAASFVTVRIKF